MKQILLIVLVFVLFFAGSWYVRRQFPGKKSEQQSSNTDKKMVPLTSFKVKSEIIKLGNIYKMDTLKKSDYVIYNLGPESLYILDVKPDCKCTGHSKIDKTKPVAPHDSTVVTLEYRPKVPGTFQVTATVELNAENNAFLILRGEVADLTKN